MATLQELEQGLIAADKAGDIQAARLIAAEIEAQTTGAPPVTVTPEPEVNKLTESLRSLAGGALFNFADELEAAVRSGAISGPEYTKLRDQLRAQQEQFKQENPALAIGTELGGSLLMPGWALAKTGAKGLSLLPELATGAGMGALTGFGASTKEMPELQVEDALQGGASGLLFTGTMAPVGRMIAPRVRPEARQLMREGVEVTPGAAFGGGLQRAEQAAESVPFVGGPITRARERSLKSFDIAAVNRVLKNIDPNIRVPKDMEPADALKFADDQISKQYNTYVTPYLRFDPQDVNFRLALDRSVNRNKNLRAEDFAELQRQASLLVDDLSRATNPRDIQVVKSKLSRDAFNMKNSTDAAQKKYGDALQDLSNTFFANLQKQNGSIAKALKRADRAETDYMRVATAFARDIKGEVTTPAQLAQTIRQMSQSGGKIGFAEGRASPLQQLAQSGERVLGTKLPTSGTAERGMIAGLLTGGGLTGLGYLSPAAGAAALTAAASSPLLYSQTMTKNILPFLLRERPELVQSLGERLRFASPFAVPSLLNMTEQ